MKSKLLKKLLSAMLVGIVVCSLAACSGGTGEEEQPETQETAENADTEVGEGTALQRWEKAPHWSLIFPGQGIQRP